MLTTDITDKSPDQPSDEHKLNRKEIIHLGFQNKTKGEAAFNAFSYIGVGYIGVTAFSVFATWLMNDKVPRIGKWIEAGAEKLGISTTAATIATLFTGGTIASVLPVKALEDNKPKIVRKLDHIFYSEEELKNNSKIEEAHKELDELPKQTWLSVFSSRVVAFAATAAVFFTVGANNKGFFKNTLNKSLDHLSTNWGRKLDGYFNKSAKDEIKKIVEHNDHRISLPAIIDGKENKDKLYGHQIMRDGEVKDRMPSRIFQYASIDGIYTLITSVSLFVSTRIFGAFLGQDADKAAALKEHKQAKKAPHTTYPPTKDAEPTIQESPTAPESPDAKITSPTRFERVAEPQHNAELTA